VAQLVYLNSEYLPEENANVSILDRGFMFGDGVYEVIPVYGGRPFALQKHLQRLQLSLDAVDIRNPLSEDDWTDIIHRLYENNCVQGDAFVYLQVNRGVMIKREHAYSPDLIPTVLVMCQSHVYNIADKSNAGIKAITLEDNRWADCHIKSVNLLPNVMLKQQAINEGATEAILIRDGYAIEGSASNLFIVKDEVIRTPPKKRYMLGGITRDVIVEICHENKILVQEKEISEDELHDADEIWMTSSTKEIMPVIMLNQHKVGKGSVGPKWERVVNLYEAYKKTGKRG
jgi:D-alanine transaminase